MQRAAVLWEEIVHRKLGKKEESASDSLTYVFLWKRERISSMHHYSGGDFFCVLYSVIKNGNTKNEINFPDSLHQPLKGNKYFHTIFLAGMSFNVAKLIFGL